MSLKDKGYAKGNYACVCHACKEGFNGDKRAVTCAECATKADKLALLSDIDETLESMSELVTKDGVSMFWVKLFDWGNKLAQLKQRIKDE